MRCKRTQGVFWLLLSLAVRADILKLDTVLETYLAHEGIQKYTGYIAAPGALDLTDATVSLVMHEDKFPQYHALNSSVDVLFFSTPCLQSLEGCNNEDYVNLGIGSIRDNGRLYYCCYQQDCEQDRVHFDPDIYTGLRWSVFVPGNETSGKYLAQGRFDINASGFYTLLVGNCQFGREIALNGSAIWESRGGYLDGERFGVMHYFYFLSALCFTFTTAYGMELRKHRRSALRLWILVTFLLASLEGLSRCFQFHDLNDQGKAHVTVWGMSCAVFGALKQGIGRGLALLAGMGWCFVRGDILTSTKKLVVSLAAFYTSLLLVVNCINTLMNYYTDDVGRSSAEVLDTACIALYGFLQILNGVFFVWTMNATNKTIWRLTNLSIEQTGQVRRYISLRRHYVVSVIATLLCYLVIFREAVLSSHTSTSSFRKESNEQWMFPAVLDTLFLGVLVGFSYFLRPLPHVRGIRATATVELPSFFGTDDLALSVSPQPSEYKDEKRDHSFFNKQGELS